MHRNHSILSVIETQTSIKLEWNNENGIAYI